MSDEQNSRRSLDSRVARLEADVAAIKIDVGVIKANGATKADLAELRFELSAHIVNARAELSAQIERQCSDFVKAVTEGRLATFLWFTGVVVFAQFLPAIAQFVKEVF